MRVGDLAVGLRELGHEVTVLAPFPSYPYDRLYPGYRYRLVQRETYHGVCVIRVLSVSKYGPSRVNRLLNYLSFAFSASVLGPLLVGRPDCVLVFQVSPITMAIPAVVIKALRGGRLVLWVQDLWPETLEALNVVRNHALLQLVDAMVRMIYRQCARVLVQSRGFMNAVATRGVLPNRIAYLPNWAEELYRVLPPDPEFMRAEGLDGRFNVIFAGNVGLAQNVGLLLDVARMLRGHPQIQLVIVGDGSEFPTLVERARSSGLCNVIFKGRQPLQKMPQYFAAADALLVQLRMNPAFAMTIPSKVQSYLACGRPILAALDGCGADVIREAGAGIVCRPEDAQALRDALLTLWRMPRQEREKMGTNAKRYYDRYFDRRLVLSRLDAILAGV
jgi:glycosyltransferase involved in cell wall biosynthesis